MALGDGAKLVQLSRSLLFLFLTKRPSALYTYLQQAMSRLWRVANFMLSDYLQLPPPLMCTPNVPQGTLPLDHTHTAITCAAARAPTGFVAARPTSHSLAIPGSNDVADAIGALRAHGNARGSGDSDAQQVGGDSNTTGDSSTSTVLHPSQQPEIHGILPSSASAMAMAEALARRAEQVQEYQMLGSDTMEVVKRVLSTPPLPTYGGVEWVNHFQDGFRPGVDALLLCVHIAFSSSCS
jgi:hypothetical protein